MRESQFQTPQKDQITANRRSKSTPEPSKKNRKSLNPAFVAIYEEKVPDFANDTAEFSSPKSAVSVDCSVTELSENSVVNSVTPETIVPSVQSSSSSSSASQSIITSDEYAISVASVPRCENSELDEVEVVIKHLSAARNQVLNSTTEYKSKKLLDVLLETIIKEFNVGPCKERDLVYRILTDTAILIFLSFMLGLLAVFVFLFLTSRESGHSVTAPPT